MNKTSRTVQEALKKVVDELFSKSPKEIVEILRKHVPSDIYRSIQELRKYNEKKN